MWFIVFIEYTSVIIHILVSEIMIWSYVKGPNITKIILNFVMKLSRQRNKERFKIKLTMNTYVQVLFRILLLGGWSTVVRG